MYVCLCVLMSASVCDIFQHCVSLCYCMFVIAFHLEYQCVLCVYFIHLIMDVFCVNVGCSFCH